MNIDRFVKSLIEGRVEASTLFDSGVLSHANINGTAIGVGKDGVRYEITATPVKGLYKSSQNYQYSWTPLSSNGEGVEASTISADVGHQLAKYFQNSADEQGVDIEEMGWGLDTPEQHQAVHDGASGKPLTTAQTQSLINAVKEMANSSGLSVEEMTGIAGVD